MRKGLVILWLTLLAAATGFLFWRNEWVYSLPTPVPAKYTPVTTGTVIPVAQNVNTAHKKVLFLHFFNPSCPCSKFNITHFKELVKQYQNNVQFAMVVMTDKRDIQANDIQKKYDLKIPVLFDSSIAAACGVYSTPQAAIIDADNKLFYRGNYNKSRYCTDKKTNYAQMALEALLAKRNQPVTDRFALIPYGCQLPACRK